MTGQADRQREAAAPWQGADGGAWSASSQTNAASASSN